MRNQLKSPHNGGGNGRGKPEHEGLDLLVTKNFVIIASKNGRNNTIPKIVIIRKM
jgi:hypothetical protein